MVQTAVISEQGRRPEMEDAHFLDSNFGGRGWLYGGIYDGHGGSFAARYAADNLHQRFLGKVLAGSSPEQAFVESYQEISRELADQDSGATAVDFFIRDNEVVAVNAGDARDIIIGERSVYQLTTDHRLTDTQEQERIKGMGGVIKYPYVYRGFAGLMPTRTLGDEYFKSVGIIATPSVKRYRITAYDLMLVAACDGLFDFMTNEEVADFVRRFRQPDGLVEALKNEVLVNRLGTDNLTIIAVSLK